MQMTMKLAQKPFLAVGDGKKTVEMRLLDEKRKKLSAGDIIEFINMDNPEQTVKTKVVAVKVYANFAELYTNYTKSQMGYEADEVADPKDMEKYFSLEKQKKYCAVVAIEIKKI